MRRMKAIGLMLLLVLVILAGSWVTLLLAAHPAQHPLANIFPWPIVCTTRGCITSQAWIRQQELVKAFVGAVGQPVPAPEEALTTLVRQHLVNKSLVQEVVTLEDATRYRRDVLRLNHEAVAQKLSTLSLEDFDRAIVLPFLKQEALRQQLKLEPSDNLFVHLSSQRWIIVLPRKLAWDKVNAEIVKRD